MADKKRPIDGKNPLATYLQKTKCPIVLEEIILELESTNKTNPELESAKNELQKIKAVVAVPLFAEDRLIGVLTLGDKKNKEMYTDDDIDFLKTVSNQLAVGLERARLHQEMVAKEKLASLGTAAAGMVHEIKNPLAVIEGMSESIVSAFENGKRQTIEDYKKIVPQELKRINNLVQDLLTYSKPSELNKVSLNMNNILQDALNTYALECEKKQILTEKNLGTIPNKHMDFEKMKQAFTNLILNAIQAMPNGGKLYIETYSKYDKIFIKIKDSGTGITKKDLKNMFDPFYSTKEKGTGLGLAITYKIIKEHQGEITAESDPRSGTVFTISL
ncbi:MAG: GAF domain-containing protein [Candidatus Saganbacteria bacterium]|nr:GAF domain-containing protein [Candidatus Saganbacteria bacterium]